MSLVDGRPAAAAAAGASPAAVAGGITSSLYDRLVLVIVAVMLILLGTTFRDYGITTDEFVQQVYGEKLWAFYLSGFDDSSVFIYDNLHFYGGLFDMVAVALQHISPFDTYDTRHLLSGFIGVLGVVAVWRLTRLLAGPRAGFLAAALLACSAAWYGAMFNNTKDIPFAVAMTWMLHLGCRIVLRLPRPPWRIVLGFGAALGLALGLRVGAALGMLCFLATVGACFVHRGRLLGWRPVLGEAAAFAAALLPALALAYGLMAVFWPWSVLSPLNPLDAISGLTQFPFRTELDNQFFPANNLPAAYLPVYIVIKLPEVVLIGILAAFVAAALRLTGRGEPHPRAPNGTGWAPWLLLALWVAVPIAYFVIGRPSLYNGMRHFFFVVPPLCTLAAVGLDRLLLWTAAWRPQAAALVAGLLLAAAIHEMGTMRALHPHQYIYYNALVGGPGGAFRRYEMDYWSNFLPEALVQLERKLQSEQAGGSVSRRYTVGLCTREEILAAYDAPFLTAIKDWKRADFIITTTNTDCDLYAGGRTIIEVARDGAVLGVVKDRRPGMKAEGTTTAPPIR